MSHHPPHAVPQSELLSLTEVEHVGRRDEGHDVNSRGERQHADQDERHVADAAAKRDDTEEAGEENRAACCVPVTHLEQVRQRNKAKEKIGQEFDRNGKMNTIYTIWIFCIPAIYVTIIHI